MLLSDVINEFHEIREITNPSERYASYREEMITILIMKNSDFTVERAADLLDCIRDLTKIQVRLDHKSKELKSKSVQNYIYNFNKRVDSLFKDYSKLMKLISANEKSDKNIREAIYFFKGDVKYLYERLVEINLVGHILLSVSEETWEPLPTDLEVKCENIIISSETKGITLNDISKDIESLNNFFNNMYSIINKDKENSYFLRKVETGSLSVVISCITAASSIVSFIFLIIKLCQNTEKRNLNNKDKRLELINKSLDMAKKILEIDPQNTEANEVIQRSGLYLLQYFENNPKGMINGEKYDIGTEVLKIEEKKDE